MCTAFGTIRHRYTFMFRMGFEPTTPISEIVGNSMRLLRPHDRCELQEPLVVPDISDTGERFISA